MSSPLDLAINLGRYLAQFQSQETGALLDPDEQRCIENSYGNAFYALLCAKLHTVCEKEHWKEKALRAFHAELHLAKRYHQIDGIYRWEFKNYALLQIYTILKKDLSSEEKIEFEHYLHHYKNICSYQTNYTMMRALNAQLRYNIFERTKDKIRAKAELFLVLSRQDKDGFFFDDNNSNSLQYHAYILALLAQYHSLDPQEKIKDAFLRGVNFLLPFIDQQGDFNYFGRGQRQVFGYASFYYALLYAYHLTNNTYYQKTAEHISLFFFPTLEQKQIVAIPTISSSQNNKIGWYPYNNQSDYLSVAGYYLLLGSQINSQTNSQTNSNFSTTIFNFEKPYNHYYPSLNAFLLREKNFLICLGGTPSNHAELPLIIHGFPSFFGTSGGPALSLTTISETEELYTGVPGSGGTLTFRTQNNILEAVHDNPTHITSYRVEFKDSVKLDIVITPKKTIIMPSFHCLTNDIKKIKSNLSFLRKGKVASLDGDLDIYEANSQTITAPICFSVSFGHLKDQHTLNDIKTKSPSHTFNRILRYPYFGTILTGKILRDPRDAYLMLRYAKIREGYYHPNNTPKNNSQKNNSQK